MDQSIAATRARQHRTAGSNSGRSGGTNSSVESLAERAGTLLASSPASGRNFVAALFSGSLATIAPQPADLLKTHQQLTVRGPGACWVGRVLWERLKPQRSQAGARTVAEAAVRGRADGLPAREPSTADIRYGTLFA
jgi:hypothetical protein